MAASESNSTAPVSSIWPNVSLISGSSVSGLNLTRYRRARMREPSMVLMPSSSRYRSGGVVVNMVTSWLAP